MHKKVDNKTSWRYIICIVRKRSENQMAYINAEDVKAIRNELKATFPKFKFGVKK